METVQRRARLFFDTRPQPPHVMFDDGKNWRRILPWMRFAGAHWSYAEPDMIRMEIDEWVIAISGHNLEPLFLAIENHTLAGVHASPEREHNRDYESDTFVTSIHFARGSSDRHHDSAANVRVG